LNGKLKHYEVCLDRLFLSYITLLCGLNAFLFLIVYQLISKGLDFIGLIIMDCCKAKMFLHSIANLPIAELNGLFYSEKGVIDKVAKFLLHSQVCY